MIELQDKLADIIEEEYLFEDKASALAEAVRNFQIPTSSNQSIARIITDALIGLSGDKHFLLQYAPDKVSGQTEHEAIMKAHTEEARTRNFGFETLQWLPGNIGYWKLNELAPVFISSKLIQTSLTFLENTDRIILDLSDCEGGESDTVQFIASIFLDAGLALSGVESRKAGHYEVQTLSDIEIERLLDKPLSILISERTFSAGEALAYDLQAQQRAKIIGQISRGGAHLSDFFPIDAMWLFRVPVARAWNPITEDNWEGKGVIPDITVDDALQSALKLDI